MLYHTRPKTWNLNRVKASGFDDRKRVHISIVKSQEFLAECGIKPLFLLAAFIFTFVFSTGDAVEEYCKIACHHPPCKKVTVEERIQQIPFEDRCLIEAFFNVLLFKEAGAYVLFGDKPSAYAVYFDFEKENKKLALEAISKHADMLRRYRMENWQLRSGWETWKKYRHLFPSNQWLLEARPMPDRQGIELFLINKRLFKKQIEENLPEFQSILGKSLTTDSLLHQYENKNISLFDLLKRHHALLGILLGFGKRNAWLFQSRDRTYPDRGSFTPIANLQPSPGFRNVSEERIYYAAILKPSFPQKNWKCFQSLYLPYFLADRNSRETKELQKKYISQRRLIHTIYRDKSFLLATLQKFCED